MVSSGKSASKSNQRRQTILACTWHPGLAAFALTRAEGKEFALPLIASGDMAAALKVDITSKVAP